jgi:hypothetical protein
MFRWMGCGKEEKCIHNFGGKVRRKDLLEDVGVDWRIMVKMDLKETGFEGADWIYLAVYSRQVAISCERATDPAVTLQLEVCFEYLRNSAFQEGPFFLELVYDIKLV